MQNKTKKMIAWTALIAAVLMVGLFITVSNQRQQLLVDSGETGAVVKTNLNTLLGENYVSAEETTLLDAVKQFSTSAYIAQTWLFDPAGKVVYVHGGPLTKDTFTLEDRLTKDAQQVLTALPQDTLTNDQLLILKISSAIQAEGEHSDVFKYFVNPIYDNNHHLIAYLAGAYDISTGIRDNNSNFLYRVSLIVMALSFMVYWISLPAWAWLDAKQRGERAWVWGAYVLLGNLVALIAYLLVRVPIPVEQQ
jgi:hypothetical protein